MDQRTRGEAMGDEGKGAGRDMGDGETGTRARRRGGWTGQQGGDGETREQTDERTRARPSTPNGLQQSIGV